METSFPHMFSSIFKTVDDMYCFIQVCVSDPHVMLHKQLQWIYIHRVLQKNRKAKRKRSQGLQKNKDLYSDFQKGYSLAVSSFSVTE